MKVILLIISMFCVSITYSQDKKTVINPVNGAELETVICYDYKKLPVFHFQENSNNYKHLDSIKYLVKILIEYDLKPLKLYASATTQELLNNSTLSKERGEVIAQLIQDFGYNLENIQITDVRDQNPRSHIKNDPQNRRVEIAIITD